MSDVFWARGRRGAGVEEIDERIEKRADAGEITDREVFEIAVEHFTGEEVDGADVDAVWAELADRELTTEEVAEQFAEPLSDIASLLDWAADFGLVDEVESTDGDLCYVRFDNRSARYAHRFEQAEAVFGGDAIFTVLRWALVVFAVILFGSLVVVAVGGTLRLVAPAPIWEQTAQIGVDGLWFGFVGLMAVFVLTQVPGVLRGVRENLEE